MGISEAIQKLEDLRQKMIIIFAVGALCAVAFLLYVINNPNPNMLFMFPFGMVIIFVVIILLYTSVNKNFKNLYKKTFVEDVLKSNFEKVVYVGDKGFSSEKIKKAGLSRLGNQLFSEDYIKGVYKGVEFEQADVTIRYRSNGKNGGTTTYFKGRMFEFTYPAKKAVSIQIFSNNFNYRAKNVEGFKVKKIEFEEMAFNKLFDVLSVDELEAFYVLTPHVMERIKQIKEYYGNIAFHFSHGKLYVAFNSNRNAFDASIQKKIDYPSEKEKIDQDVQVIKNIIEEMILMQQ